MKSGQCCSDESGCWFTSNDRCPIDRDSHSIGCGLCNVNGGYETALMGSKLCGNCEKSNPFNYILLCIVWSFVVLFSFGIVVESNKNSEYDPRLSAVLLFQATLLLVMDFYQTLPSILIIVPNQALTPFINLFMAKLPTTYDGMCFYQGICCLCDGYVCVCVYLCVVCVYFM